LEQAVKPDIITDAQKSYWPCMNLSFPLALAIEPIRRANMEVDHQTFDWIFFAIVAIPFLLGLVQLAFPNWLEPLIRDR
jgi:hypothetical protein